MLNTLASSSPAGIVSDEQSVRLWVLIGTTKAWHILKTPIKFEGWAMPAYQSETESLKRAWEDLRCAIGQFNEGRESKYTDAQLDKASELSKPENNLRRNDIAKEVLGDDTRGAALREAVVRSGRTFHSGKRGRPPKNPTK